MNNPRILKINWIKDLSVSVVFNNGESRIIDFNNLFEVLCLDKKGPAGILLTPEELSKAEVQENTLSWSNVEQYITTKNGGSMKVPLQVSPDVLFKYSIPELDPFMTQSP